MTPPSVGFSCPRCRAIQSDVIETRPLAGGRQLRRRRRCIAPDCGALFTTYEKLGADPNFAFPSRAESSVNNATGSVQSTPDIALPHTGNSVQSTLLIAPLHPTRARPRAGSDPDQIRIRDLDPKGSIQENAVGADIREDANSSPAPVSVMAFPASGKTPAWYLTEAWLAEAVAAFPGLDVPADLRIALAKVNTGAVRKPTARGMSRFLMGWLSRSNDRRPPAPTTAPPDLRCVWHRDPKNDVRASAYPKPGCPRCKHFAARDRKRQGEPTELGELMAQKAAEVEAAAERERLAGRERWARDQAPADPPKRTEKTGTGG